jgi:hypothetical protein
LLFVVCCFLYFFVGCRLSSVVVSVSQK